MLDFPIGMEISEHSDSVRDDFCFLFVSLLFQEHLKAMLPPYVLTKFKKYCILGKKTLITIKKGFKVSTKQKEV